MTPPVELPPERPGRPAPPDLAERRAGMDAALAAGTWKTAKPPIEITIGGRRTLCFLPQATPKGRVMHLHGGGFRIGGPDMEGPFAAALAEHCQVEVVVPQYRLAPEHPFPAGLSDALGVLRLLREESGNAPLIVSGDSAGGGLAASLAVLGAVRIDGLVLLSPWLDLTVSAPSYDANAASDPMFSKESASIAAELYLQGFDPLHPLASPLHARIASYPPTLVSVGTGEVLLDDSLRFHDRLLATGGQSQLCAIGGMEHVAVIRSMAMPGAAETFEAIVAFVNGIIQP